MDLRVPYEVNSDQDVASMFVLDIPADCTSLRSTNKTGGYYKPNSNACIKTTSLFPDQESTGLENESEFNPSDLIVTSRKESLDKQSSSNAKYMEVDEEDTATINLLQDNLTNQIEIANKLSSQPNNYGKILDIPVLNCVKQNQNIGNCCDNQIQNDVKLAVNTGVNHQVSLAHNHPVKGETNKTNKLNTSISSLSTISNQPGSAGLLQCPNCVQKFPLDADLTQHHCTPSNTNEDILSCTICRTTFEAMDKLKDHMRKHWESLPYKCHVCSERYWNEKSLKRHLIKHEAREKPFTCVECNAKYVHKRQLLLHMANIHSRDKAFRKFQCDICSRNFVRKCDLAKHVKKCVDLEEESPLIESDLCPIIKSPITTLATDNDTKTNEDLGSTGNSPQFDSPATHDSLSPQADDKERLSPSQDSLSASLVPGATIPAPNLLNILNSIQGSGIPAIVPFFNTNGLAQNIFISPLFSMLPFLPITNCSFGHNNQRSDSKNNVDTNDKTNICTTITTPVSENTTPPVSPSQNLSTSRRKSKPQRRTISTILSDINPKPVDTEEKAVDLVEIIRRSQTLARPEDQVPDPKEGALYNCQHCKKSFPTLTELEQHAAQHGSYVFSCKYCKKLLSSQVSLFRHEADHEDNRPFKCTSCDRAFVLKAELSRHTEIQHSMRPFTCNICRFQFSCQANLDAHMPVHVEKKTCTFCPRSFTTETYLQRHMVKHHGTKQSA